MEEADERPDKRAGGQKGSSEMHSHGPKWIGGSKMTEGYEPDGGKFAQSKKLAKDQGTGI